MEFPEQVKQVPSQESQFDPFWNYPAGHEVTQDPLLSKSVDEQVKHVVAVPEQVSQLLLQGAHPFPPSKNSPAIHPDSQIVPFTTWLAIQL